MADGHNAGVLQDIKNKHAAATQPDLHVAPTVVEPPLGTETSDAAFTEPVPVTHPAPVSPVEPVAKAPAGRRTPPPAKTDGAPS